VREVAERLLGRQAEALLAQGEAELQAERSLDAARRQLEAGREADATFDGRHEQVDELRDLAVDLIEAQAGTPLHPDVGQVPAHHDQHHGSEERPRVETAAEGEQDQDRQAGKGRENALADERRDRGLVQPGRVQQVAGPLLRCLQPVEARQRALSGRRRKVLERGADVVGALLDGSRRAKAVSRDLIERAPPFGAGQRERPQDEHDRGCDERETDDEDEGH
jgi:hypothetical protein